jgi:hypothetical protein
MDAKKYYHCSGSASLLGVLDRESPGLKSLGTLQKEGKAFYSGVLDIGVSNNGISWRAICVLDENHLSSTMRYSLAPRNRSWTPEISRERVLGCNKELLRIAVRRRERREKGEGDSAEANDYEDSIRNVLSIELKRQEQWENYGNLERTLIKNQFPVIYELSNLPRVVPAREIHSRRAKMILFPDNPNVEIDPSYTGEEGEIFIPDTVGLENMTIYVPQGKKKQVEKLARPFSGLPRIATFETLQQNIRDGYKLRGIKTNRTPIDELIIFSEDRWHVLLGRRMRQSYEAISDKLRRL